MEHKTHFFKPGEITRIQVTPLRLRIGDTFMGFGRILHIRHETCPERNRVGTSMKLTGQPEFRIGPKREQTFTVLRKVKAHFGRIK